MDNYSFMPPGFMSGVDSENCNNNNNSHADTVTMPLGMAYVPIQSWRQIYEKDKGLIRGTIFAELDLPFKGAKR